MHFCKWFPPRISASIFCAFKPFLHRAVTVIFLKAEGFQRRLFPPVMKSPTWPWLMQPSAVQPCPALRPLPFTLSLPFLTPSHYRPYLCSLSFPLLRFLHQLFLSISGIFSIPIELHMGRFKKIFFFRVALVQDLSPPFRPPSTKQPLGHFLSYHLTSIHHISYVSHKFRVSHMVFLLKYEELFFCCSPSY